MGMLDLAAGPVVAAFDFDGTLTRRDSFFRFLAWHRPRVEIAWDLAVTAPLLARYAIGRAPNDLHKMALFARRFRGVPVEAYRRRARDFAREGLPALLRREALDRLRRHRERGDRIVIVTASLVDWVEPLAAAEGVEAVLGSEAEVRDGRLTGGLATRNCYGAEKLRRLLGRFPERREYTLVVYGDSRGDRELLKAADHAYYRRFA